MLNRIYFLVIRDSRVDSLFWICLDVQLGNGQFSRRTKKETTIVKVFNFNLTKSEIYYIGISWQVVLTCSLKSCSFADHCHKFPPDSKFPRISGPETVSSVTTTSIKAARESRIFKNDRFVLTACECRRVPACCCSVSASSRHTRRASHSSFK